MESTMFMILFFIIIAICAPVLYKVRNEDNITSGDIIYNAYMSNTFFLFIILNLIYSSKVTFTALSIIILIAWLVYRIFLRTSKGKKLKRDPKFYKSLAVPAPFVGIIVELLFFIIKPFNEYSFLQSESQFKIFSFISILILTWILYFSSRHVLSSIFKEEDNFRKAYIIGEIILVVIYVAFTIYYILNTNLLSFWC